MTEAVTYQVDEHGICTLVMDLPGEKMNVLGPVLTEGLENSLRRAFEDSIVKGIVLTSGKETFLAGGDLKLMTSTDVSAMPPAEVAHLFGSLSRLLRWMETAGKPVATALNGLALGGGLEIALASHYRVVVDDPKVMLGLPESQVGLLPGGGGTQRLPRLIGLREALPLLAQGKNVSPDKALALGLVDAVVPRDQLLGHAKAWLRGNPEPIQPWDKKGFSVPGGGNSLNADFRNTFLVSNAMTRANTFGNYPGQEQLLIALYEGLQLPMDKALAVEARCFAKLIIDPVARNQIRTFFISKGQADALAARPKDVPRTQFTKIGVVGAGTMGAGIAFSAAKAGIEAVLLDRDAETAARGKAHAEKRLQRDIERGRSTREKADRILARIHTADDYAALAECQLVIEAVFEDRAVKQAVIEQISAAVSADAIIASNTSALPISMLAAFASHPERFVGTHFFSPVERMPLVEIIRGEKTSESTWAIALDLAAALRKTPITVNDGPGFFTSRFIGAFVTASLDMVEGGVNPALVENGARMVGMPMGALLISDTIGLDLSHQAGVSQAKERGEEPRNGIISKLVVDHRRMGAKTGQGFYDHAADGSRALWPGLSDLLPRLDEQPSIDEVKDRILYAQLAEGARAFAEGVLLDVVDGDLGATLGVGFPAFYGGPFSAMDTLGVAAVIERCDQLCERYGALYAIPDLIRQMAETGQTFYGDQAIASPGAA